MARKRKKKGTGYITVETMAGDRVVIDPRVYDAQKRDAQGQAVGKKPEGHRAAIDLIRLGMKGTGPRRLQDMTPVHAGESDRLRRARESTRIAKDIGTSRAGVAPPPRLRRKPGTGAAGMLDLFDARQRLEKAQGSRLITPHKFGPGGLVTAEAPDRMRPVTAFVGPQSSAVTFDKGLGRKLVEEVRPGLADKPTTTSGLFTDPAQGAVGQVGTRFPARGTETNFTGEGTLWREFRRPEPVAVEVPGGQLRLNPRDAAAMREELREVQQRFGMATTPEQRREKKKLTDDIIADYRAKSQPEKETAGKERPTVDTARRGRGIDIEKHRGLVARLNASRSMSRSEQLALLRDADRAGLRSQAVEDLRARLGVKGSESERRLTEGARKRAGDRTLDAEYFVQGGTDAEGNRLPPYAGGTAEGTVPLPDETQRMQALEKRFGQFTDERRRKGDLITARDHAAARWAFYNAIRKTSPDDAEAWLAAQTRKDAERFGVVTDRTAPTRTRPESTAGKSGSPRAARNGPNGEPMAFRPAKDVEPQVAAVGRVLHRIGGRGGRKATAFRQLADKIASGEIRTAGQVKAALQKLPGDSASEQDIEQLYAVLYEQGLLGSD